MVQDAHEVHGQAPPAAFVNSVSGTVEVIAESRVGTRSRPLDATTCALRKFTFLFCATTMSRCVVQVKALRVLLFS